LAYILKGAIYRPEFSSVIFVEHSYLYV